MKTIKLFAAIAIALSLSSATLIAQEEQERPKYIAVTTLHWNMDNEDFNMKEWIEVEKEFSDKVTKKNEHVMGAGFYMHRYTPDNREIIYVQTFATWDAIDDAVERGNELAKEAWPDESARDAFFEKQQSYYGAFHSDEIYATMSGAKLMTEAPGDDMILYVRKSHFAFPEDGSQKEFNELRDPFIENVINKNELIKGYYPSTHYYGSDRTEFVEAFMVNSMTDLDKMLVRNGELIEAAWPDETKRMEMNKKWGEYFTGVHGDYIYTLIEELAK